MSWTFLAQSLALAMEPHLGTALARDRAVQIALTDARRDPAEFAAAMGRTQILAATLGQAIPSAGDVERASEVAAAILREHNEWTNIDKGD